MSDKNIEIIKHIQKTGTCPNTLNTSSNKININSDKYIDSLTYIKSKLDAELDEYLASYENKNSREKWARIFASDIKDTIDNISKVLDDKSSNFLPKDLLDICGKEFYICYKNKVKKVTVTGCGLLFTKEFGYEYVAVCAFRQNFRIKTILCNISELYNSKYEAELDCISK